MSLSPKPRVAVISPFLDKRHGTERCVVEQLERLAHDYEIHVYSNHVEDLDLRLILWHRVLCLPGPHLFRYCWWLIANFLHRQWDGWFGGLKFDLIYTPGINCFDADIISIHICFAEFLRLTRDVLKFSSNPAISWPRLLHRRVYYRLIIALEKAIYRGNGAVLTVVSSKVGRDLRCYGQVAADLPVILHGIDMEKFNPEVRRKLRSGARRALGLQDGVLCLLLIGNDWKKKGLPCVMEALGRLENHSLRLLVVGQDKVGPYRTTLDRLRLKDRVAFLPLRADVEFYYAAADIYVGPSLEDAFGLPPAEAMACGVPCIVSGQAGVSEIITPGVDGLVLDDPHDCEKLAELISMLYRDEGLREGMGKAAEKTAKQYTWDKNAAQLNRLFQEVLRRKRHDCLVVPKEELAS